MPSLYFFRSVLKKVSLHPTNLARGAFCHSYKENGLSNLLGKIYFPSSHLTIIPVFKKK